MRAGLQAVLLGLVLLGGIGCETMKSHVKAPKIPEEYRDPPANDTRYVEAPRYPRDERSRALAVRRQQVVNVSQQEGLPPLP